MKERNCRKSRQAEARENDQVRTYLQERVLLLALELVGAEKFKTAVGLLVVKTILVALKQLENVIDDDSLKVDLLLVVEVLGLELNLRAGESTSGQTAKEPSRDLPETCQPWRLFWDAT